MKLRAMIVDDEFNASSNLQMMLQDFCPEVEVTAICNSAAEAREALEEHDVDVVFLDIKMPGEDGFSMLSSLPSHDFSVVFTTAHNEFALKAFRAGAIDYLEKPISVDDLQQAVAKVMRMHQAGTTNTSDYPSLEEMFKHISAQRNPEKMAIPTRDGYLIVDNKEIVRLEACDSYTNIYLSNGKRYMSSKNIKVYEDMLSKRDFFRTHKSHIINARHHLKEFSRADGNFAILSDASTVPVSRRKLPEFLGHIASF
ncbi:MAG: DNA-binding response regulator [Cryomorphaceae bacterium]|nr:MAG: DNA-binding response regulator [Cryomorphaceae bacterium]